MEKTRAVHRLRLFARCFSKNNTGATAIEYALVAMLIAMAIVAALPAIAPPINSTFSTVSAKL